MNEMGVDYKELFTSRLLLMSGAEQHSTALPWQVLLFFFIILLCLVPTAVFLFFYASGNVIRFFLFFFLFFLFPDVAYGAVLGRGAVCNGSQVAYPILLRVSYAESGTGTANVWLCAVRCWHSHYLALLYPVLA